MTASDAARERLAETLTKLRAEIERADRRGEEITAENLRETAALVESLTHERDKAIDLGHETLADLAAERAENERVARELADERVKSATYLETAKFHERNADSLARELADTRAVLEAAQRLLDETKLWLPWTPTNTFTPEVGQALQDLAAALSAGRTPKEPA